MMLERLGNVCWWASWVLAFAWIIFAVTVSWGDAFGRVRVSCVDSYSDCIPLWLPAIYFLAPVIIVLLIGKAAKYILTGK